MVVNSSALQAAEWCNPSTSCYGFCCSITIIASGDGRQMVNGQWCVCVGVGVDMASPVVWIRQLSGASSLDLSHSDLVRYRCYKRKSVGAHPVHLQICVLFLRRAYTWYIHGCVRECVHVRACMRTCVWKKTKK